MGLFVLEVVWSPFLGDLFGYEVCPFLHPFEVSLLLPQVVGQHLGYRLHGAPDGVPASSFGADEEYCVDFD